MAEEGPFLDNLPLQDQIGNDEGEAEDDQAVNLMEVQNAAPVVAPVETNQPQAPDRMELSDQERFWALDIKAAIETDPEIDNLSDYMYAQLALICQGDSSGAVERAQGLQYFREEYCVLDTVPEGQKAVSDYLNRFAGMCLSLSYYQAEGNYVMVADWTAFEVDKVRRNPENMRILCRGLYFLYHAMTPDFTSIRQGVLMICECDGFDWRKNIDIDTLRKLWTELGMVYPVEYKKIKYFNSGVFMNLLQSLKKRFLPAHLTRKTETGCKMPDGRRLNYFYSVPNMEAANQRTYVRVSECLMRRKENEMNFRLC